MIGAERAKQLLSRHGEVRPQSRGEWRGSFLIPPAVERFYSEVGPSNITVEAHGNPYFLPSLVELWNFQAGYRWNGLTGEPIENWDDDWLVVADEGGDPFLFARSSGVVLHAYHGEGAWDAREIFPDLNSMAACLAEIGNIVVDAGDAYMNEDCSIRPKYRELAAKRFMELLGLKASADRALRALGWR